MNYKTFFIWSSLLSFTANFLKDLSPFCLDFPFAWLLLCQPQQTGSVKLLWHLPYCLIHWSLHPLANLSAFDTTEHVLLVQLASSSTSSHSSSSTLATPQCSLYVELCSGCLLILFSVLSLCSFIYSQGLNYRPRHLWLPSLYLLARLCSRDLTLSICVPVTIPS